MPDAGFPKKLRLANAAEFKAVFSKVEYKISNRHLLIFALENARNYPRLGLVISKKHVPLAVDRNRIKRLLRDEFRTHQHLLAGLDIVILARNDLAAQNNASLHSAISRLWKDLSKQHGSRINGVKPIS